VIFCFFIFKLEEEEMSALLLHLPAFNAESPIFCSASGLGCRLVVGFAQAAQFLVPYACGKFYN
jgi:hypothetical protein